ncbi:MAG: DUF4149 domain-containing protein [Burkholderiaceae bacterium]|nr:DUF4149 domain-containing protein [Burkholderiaceae bacterium]MDO9090604.1 DUF4149 domain-containing protein [Burkholderiaceae bacterium]
MAGSRLQSLAVLCAALWWGSLGAIGFMAVPLLFAHLPTPADAGRMAARLFSAQTWLSMACGMLLLMFSRGRGGGVAPHWAKPVLPFILGAMLLALLVEFAIAPRIVARDNLRLWHGLGSAGYLLQWLCAGVVLWKIAAASSQRAAQD